MLSHLVAFVMMRLMTHQVHDAVEALDAETFDFVGGSLGGGLDSGNAAQELGHHTTHDIAALGVWAIGGDSDGLNRMESDLLNGLLVL